MNNIRRVNTNAKRRAPQGARGLKCLVVVVAGRGFGRAPQGARGLKFQAGDGLGLRQQSRPARGAWIEMAFDMVTALVSGGRAPQGARGLKL